MRLFPADLMPKVRMALPRLLLFGRDPLLDEVPWYLRRAFKAANECTAPYARHHELELDAFEQAPL